MPYINEQNLPYLWERIKQLVTECGCQNCSGGGSSGGTTDSALTDAEVTASTPIECKEESLSEALWCGTGTGVADAELGTVEANCGSWNATDVYNAFYDPNTNMHLLKAYVYEGTSTDPMFIMTLGHNVEDDVNVEFIGSEYSSPTITQVAFIVDQENNSYVITLKAPNTVLTAGTTYRVCIHDTGITYASPIS